MATVGSRGEPGGGGSEPGVSASIRKMADRARQTFQAARLAAQLRRVPLVPGAVDEMVAAAPVILHRDILNIVGSPPGDSTEVQFVRDADMRLRAYAPCCPHPSLFDLFAEAFPDAAPNSTLGTDGSGNLVLIPKE